MSLHHYSKSQPHRSIRGVVRTRPRRTLNKWSKEFNIRPHRRRTLAVQSHSPMCPRVTHASFGPPESTTQTASRSVKPFLHSSRQSVVAHVGACPRPSPSKLLIPVGDLELHPIYSSLSQSEPTTEFTASRPVRPFLQGYSVTDRQTDRETDRPRYSVGNNTPHLRT